jgi:hypothetical protein
MRTIAATLAALAFACASSQAIPQPSGRVALILDRRGPVLHSPLLLSLGAQLHATTIVTRDTPIDERLFDTVIVIKQADGSLREPSYDVTTRGASHNEVMPVRYEIRRAGIVTRKGSLKLVMPDFGSSCAQPYLFGVNRLLRDVAAP